MEKLRDAVHNQRMMADPTHALRQQFLAWIEAAPRRYGDVMEAWRTSCPRLTIWEDAVRDGLVSVQNGGAMRDAMVGLTPRGRAALAEAAPALAGSDTHNVKTRSPRY